MTREFRERMAISMLAFFIFISVMLTVSYMDFRDAVKTRQPKLIVFYSVLFGLSLTLAAMHCLGVSR